MEKLFAPEVLIKMRNPDISMGFCVFFKKAVIKTPVVRQVGAYQYDVAGFKTFDVVPNELGAFTFLKMDQFDLGVIVPPVVNVGNKVLPYAKRPVRSFRYFE